MNVWEYVLGILLIAVSVALVIVVLFQKERASTSRNALDTSSDSSDSYYGKNKGRSKEAVMSKVTRVLAVALFVLTIAINLFILAPKYKADQAASASAAAASASAASASAASASAASGASSETASAASSAESSSEAASSGATASSEQ